MKTPVITKSKVEFMPIQRDYEGMAKLLIAFSELYNTCDNKELLDELMRELLTDRLIVHENNKKR
jgi:hypothetical protein